MLGTLKATGPHFQAPSRDALPQLLSLGWKQFQRDCPLGLRVGGGGERVVCPGRGPAGRRGRQAAWSRAGLDLREQPRTRSPGWLGSQGRLGSAGGPLQVPSHPSRKGPPLALTFVPCPASSRTSVHGTQQRIREEAEGPPRSQRRSRPWPSPGHRPPWGSFREPGPWLLHGHVGAAARASPGG